MPPAQRRRRALLCAPAVAALLGAGGVPRPASASTPPPAAPGCPLFGADNVWNTDIAGLPVHPRSPEWIASMGGASRHIHPDFGPSGGDVPYGIPYTVVDHSHQRTSISFQYANESDPGPYPFGADTPIEGGASSTGDRHALMLDRDSCTLYELYDARYASSGSTAGSGAIFDLRSNGLRPDGWTSADAAGLPMLPGLLRPDEVASGLVGHAIRVTASSTDASHLWPARHDAGSGHDASLPPMGARFRLRAGVDIGGYGAATQVVLRAMQHYGLIVADNGSDWFFGGTAENGWDPTMIAELKTIPAGDFEAVDESSLMVSPDSAQARQPAAGPPPDSGYWLVGGDGGVFPFGRDAGHGSTGALRLNRPIVGAAATPDHGGYWLVAADGGIFPFGDAAGYGSTGGIRLNRPIVGIAATPSGHGYWLAASDGGIFPFGDAAGYGSTGNVHLNQPIVGIAATADGHGYWLVARDGGIFPFGDAAGYGSTGGIHLNQPIVAAATTADGQGYWLAAADGGIFPFGDAAGLGSTGGIRLNSPIAGIAATPGGAGYWLVAADGGIFPFGDAPGLGSLAGRALTAPVVSITAG